MAPNSMLTRPLFKLTTSTPSNKGLTVTLLKQLKSCLVITPQCAQHWCVDKG